FVSDLILDELKPLSLLDIGCGDGRLLNMLSGKIDHLVGVDKLEAPILFAQAFNPGLQFYVGEAAEVPDRFQVTTLIEVLEHIPDDLVPAFIQPVAKKTLPDGCLLVSVPTTNVTVSKKHYRHYNLELLRAQLLPAFEIERYWYLSQNGFLAKLFNFLLHNMFGIVLSGKWRRMIWRLHKRFTFHADAGNGRHLIAVAKPRTLNGGGGA
ncbi:MAG: class I SAM-dependent methyltransferase, partial [Anaerolineales bacterium]|nr:class I SAM-dependent methyltransferase [Anaerolineales bacterium]